MSDEVYSCSNCQATTSPAQAYTANYRCPDCSRGYLVARRSPVPLIRAVKPRGLAVETDTDEAERATVHTDTPEASPASLEDALRAALLTRSRPKVGEKNTETPPEDAPASPPDHPEVDGGDSDRTSAMVILPPPYNDIDATAMEQLAATFAGLPSPVALEIVGELGQRRMLVRGEAAAVKGVVKQLYGVYRQVGAEALKPADDPIHAIESSKSFTVSTGLRPVGPEFLSLRTWREFEGQDPLNPLLSAFDSLGPGETTISQLILYGAAPKHWAEPHLRQLVALKRRGYGSDTPAPTHNILGFVGGTTALMISIVVGLWAYADWHRWLTAAPILLILALATMALFSLSSNQWAKTLDVEAEAKLRDPAFQVELRIFASAQTKARAREILEQIVAAYQLFNTTSGNQLRAVSLAEALRLDDLLPAPSAKPALLSVKEIAGLWHMPVGESLELVQRQTFERLLPLPRDVTFPDGALIGVSRKGEHNIPVQLSPEALQRNLFIIGRTQHGKSTFMEHIASHWMRDRERSVLIVDPHGDLAHRTIGLVPPERLDDVIYIDLSDATQSVSLNLLDVSDGSDPDDVAETFVDVGKALWQKYWGPRMLIPLGFSLRALTYANLRRPPERQYTILTLATLLTCKAGVRNEFLKAEVPPNERPDIFRYFEGEYANGNASQREQIISPVLSKAHAFERSAVIRRLVGQPRSSLRLFDAIRQRKIIILNTNSGVLGDDLAGFIGSLFLNVMRRVITRQTMLPRHERVQVSVVADEFQTMTGTDFGALLGELQKNGGNFVLGTQSLDSLRRIDESGALTGMIFAGVATTVALRVNSEDARLLVDGELDVERLRSESLVNLPPHVAYIKTINNDGQAIPVFSLEVALPLTPDPQVVNLILARRSAYTVSADEAERLSRLSLNRFDDEHLERSAQRSAATGESSQATVAAQTSEPPHGTQRRTTDDEPLVSDSPVVTSDEQRASNIHRMTRPKAVPPGMESADSADNQYAAAASLIKKKVG